MIFLAIEQTSSHSVTDSPQELVLFILIPPILFIFINDLEQQIGILLIEIVLLPQGFVQSDKET